MAQTLTITVRQRIGGQVSPFSAPVVVTVGGQAETVSGGAAAGMSDAEKFSGSDRPLDGGQVTDQLGGVAVMKDAPGQGAGAGTSETDAASVAGTSSYSEPRTDGAAAGTVATAPAAFSDAPKQGAQAGDTEADTYTAGGGKLSVSDNFNRANGAISAGQPKWSPAAGITADYTIPQIASNAVPVNAGVGAVWNGDTFAADQWAEIDCGADGGNVLALLILRGNPAGGSRTFYYVNLSYSWDTDFSQFMGLSADVHKVVGGTDTLIGTVSSGTDPGVGTLRWRLEVSGNTVTAKAKAGAGSWVTIGSKVGDAAVSAGKPGFVPADPANPCDNFAAGEL